MRAFGLLVLMTAIHAKAAVVPPPSEVRAPDFPTYVFSTPLPGEFTAGDHSKLSVSQTRFRDGASASLCWEWDAPGASFTFKHPDAFKHLTGENPDPMVYGNVTFCMLSGMSLWVFNETPRQEPL